MAQAILLQDVENLGSRGESVDVSPGYLRNYLLPRKLAQSATKASLEEAERRREAAERAERESAERAQETAALLSKTVLTIHHRAGEDGKLFGSVTSKEIADGIRDARGLKIDRRRSSSMSRSTRSAPTWSRSSCPAARPPASRRSSPSRSSAQLFPVVCWNAAHARPCACGFVTSPAWGGANPPPRSLD